MNPDRREERVAYDEEPRPGMWIGERRAVGLALTQEATDALIRFELIRLTEAAERDEIIAAIGEPLIISMEGRVERDRVIDVVQATCQRGGIDSDPLVRVLAYRTWGDRARRWFEGRGVRNGDRISLVDRSDVVSVRGVALAWTGEPEIGVALGDAAPGSFVDVKLNMRGWRAMNRHARYMERLPRGGAFLRPCVSDRPRAETEFASTAHAGDQPGPLVPRRDRPRSMRSR
jgi:hypothetical protein